MNKKIISCIVLGISVFFIIYFVFFFQTTRRFSKLCVSEETYQTLIAQRTETAEELILEMTFNDYQAVYDSIDKCFYYSLIEDDPDAYDPEIGYTARDGNVKLAVKDMKISDEMIADNGGIECVAYDDTSYREYVIKCTTLPIVSIHFY